MLQYDFPVWILEELERLRGRSGQQQQHERRAWVELYDELPRSQEQPDIEGSIVIIEPAEGP